MLICLAYVRNRISASDVCTVRANDRATRGNRFPTKIARNASYFLFVGYLQAVGDLTPADFEPSNVCTRDNRGTLPDYH